MARAGAERPRGGGLIEGATFAEAHGTDLMRDLPIFVNMRDRPTVVVGSGVVAARRAELALGAGARVTVFAPELGDEFLGFKDSPNLRHAPREPTPEDFAPASLCFIATEDDGLIERARSAARSAGALVNVADRPKLSDFIMPSIVDRSPLVIAVSTGGASPILGRMLKARLESLIPSAYGRFAGLMSGFRDRLATAIPSQTMRRRFWETVLEGPIAEAALAGNLGRGENPSCGRDRALGVRARLARGRSLSGRRRPRRPRPRHFPRLPPDAEGRRGALRPADR